ncbi:16S rRNA (guanine(966)-N(2))-methyltransferase RsmD [Candidatus Saccharibacteria bacterium]|jgi:16S rRNA (guanine966-N2)-methyltransferase|nr:16S rRNA (guanine(966)-N(2))-methyltransferase RsmD [Candidatus Saccharibacteria bacterium]NCU43644.1 16S rRNA (guanine(966)-N(2))-methyltransferase RsmD [Candidatus Saccharibacteria bacterium]
MNIRLISGLFKNHKISAPNSRRTHPMSERSRNAIFNKIQSFLPEADVLDAFAGTGALGLEALSRGAGSATFIEKDRLAQKILAENLQILDKNESAGEGKLIRASVSGWLNSTTSQFELGEIAEIPTFDIIFADPPYYDPQFPTIERLSERLNEDGILILSQPKEIETFSAQNLEIIDEKLYSGAKIIYLRKK